MHAQENAKNHERPVILRSRDVLSPVNWLARIKWQFTEKAVVKAIYNAREQSMFRERMHKILTNPMTELQQPSQDNMYRYV